MMKTALIRLAAVALIVGPMVSSAHATFDVSVTDVMVDANGGMFTIKATPSAGSVGEKLVAYGMNVVFSNFGGGLSSLHVTATNQVPGLGSAPGTGSNPSSYNTPFSASDGSSIYFTGFDASQSNVFSAAGLDLMKVSFSVPGGFVPSEAFDVTVTEGGVGTETAVFTNLGAGMFSPALGTPTTIAAVPEPSAFLLLGAVVSGVGGFRWYRRRKNAA